MDKAQKEILQTAKELTAKFIETRTISPNNFAEIFPVIYRVVRETVPQGGTDEGKTPGRGPR
ncbi:MAG: hypothetical protein LBC94_01250 [Desulfovibrio sp.]|jgi:hypothetical protein|nr:hypothetical protein [Desulfovibrio sp.]